MGCSWGATAAYQYPDDGGQYGELLLFKDSYANCLVPFLTPYFREILIVDPRYYYGDITEIMRDNKISSVLFLYNGNTFVEDNSISGVLNSDETE